MSAKKSIFSIFSVLLTIILMLAVTPLQAVHAAGVRYAKPAASGLADCTSWKDACSLQTALIGASSGDQIWVKAGTYKPTNNDTDRNATFQLKSGVPLYGGFAGTETALSQRSPAVNLTILSGDIDNNDTQTPVITDLATVSGNTTNSFHVIVGATGAILDGFTITAGNANGADPYSTGSGGGMFNDYSSPAVMGVTFRGNSAEFNGGGMYNDSFADVVLTDVTFSDNKAAKGGGMYNWDNSPTLTNVTFNDNKTPIGGYGGGMANASSSPTLTDVTFRGNYSSNGAGMNNDQSNSILNKVTFRENTGGYGVGMNNDSSSPTLTNVTFFSNTGVGGAGMMNRNGSCPTLTNVTFYLNSASVGGGMQNTGSNPQIRNTIFWANYASAISPTGTAEIGNSGTSIASLSDSVVEDGCPAGSNCTNNITNNPELDWIGDFGGYTQTVPLLPGSSAIDTGNDTVCPDTDQRGVSRPQGAHCDIGAYEVSIFSIYLPLVLR